MRLCVCHYIITNNNNNANGVLINKFMLIIMPKLEVLFKCWAKGGREKLSLIRECKNKTRVKTLSKYLLDIVSVEVTVLV